VALDVDVGSLWEKRGDPLPRGAKFLVLFDQEQFLLGRPRIIGHVWGKIVEPAITALASVSAWEKTGDSIPI
jgi:hypothetical protein